MIVFEHALRGTLELDAPPLAHGRIPALNDKLVRLSDAVLFLQQLACRVKKAGFDALGHVVTGDLHAKLLHARGNPKEELPRRAEKMNGTGIRILADAVRDRVDARRVASRIKDDFIRSRLFGSERVWCLTPDPCLG